ncbi:MAG: hypothetical protein WCS52_07475 [bacterium]
MQHMYTFGQILGRTLAGGLLFLSLCLPAISAPPLFARFSTDRSTIYEGEAFQLTLAIHVTGETLAPQISIDALPAPDQMQLYPFQELPRETTTLDGLPYEVRKFRAWARAAKAGPVSLSPRLSGTFIQTTRSFFMMQESRRPASIPVETRVISIRPLPETGRPPDFSGLVGRFTFSAIPAPLNIALGDLITITYTIEGDLLPDTYLRPNIKPGPDLKVYELKPAGNESTLVRQVFNQTLVPCNSNLTALPACSLSYFDTRNMRYETLTAGPFPIHYHSEHAPAQSIYTPAPTHSNTVTPNLSEKSTENAGDSIWHRLDQQLRQGKGGTISGNDDVQVWLAPSEASLKLFRLKPGATVSLGATNENWIYVSSPSGSGWIPVAVIEKPTK